MEIIFVSILQSNFFKFLSMHQDEPKQSFYIILLWKWPTFYAKVIWYSSRLPSIFVQTITVTHKILKWFFLSFLCVLNVRSHTHYRSSSDKVSIKCVGNCQLDNHAENQSQLQKNNTSHYYLHFCVYLFAAFWINNITGFILLNKTFIQCQIIET